VELNDVATRRRGMPLLDRTVGRFDQMVESLLDDLEPQAGLADVDLVAGLQPSASRTPGRQRNRPAAAEHAGATGAVVVEEPVAAVRRPHDMGVGARHGLVDPVLAVGEDDLVAPDDALVVVEDFGEPADVGTLGLQGKRLVRGLALDDRERGRPRCRLLHGE